MILYFGVLASGFSTLLSKLGQNFCRGDTHSLSNNLQSKEKTAASRLSASEEKVHPHISSAAKRAEGPDFLEFLDFLDFLERCDEWG